MLSMPSLRRHRLLHEDFLSVDKSTWRFICLSVCLQAQQHQAHSKQSETANSWPSYYSVFPPTFSFNFSPLLHCLLGSANFFAYLWNFWLKRGLGFGVGGLGFGV